ncbi:putative P-type conjugative transfer protein TrbL [Fusobacterium necrophorum subsp. funduliforme ATCC 51357]|uniref:Putative P-type conjugative transfer protein TrbL n=1 Tax=Fusobacterium gonidiaformans 3-1-5R TaxID=469605 RepID=E5BI19_9FUSO|nr:MULTISPECIES: type IV secretion system protein [Fusobacterium]EFS22142.1 putative P-type conjugative transfer protein TrbL [Fusobacterium gonidiaformans 3-1-5R]EFS22925.1 putative P-type conjugative transfer protein TrbL [Fusobacterium necrophorum D12]EIJ72416.1 putative P-type conjugative transfer protein TrbL [Fusobacterium necrophorum subsp. funduliforme ATCC 51357]KAB0552936.1 conjugal transfer protein TrbL [Fusobacterium necrophorum subsp. funduliforme]KYM48180.1 conjugal transfer prot
MILTEILSNFIEILYKIPQNLRTMAMTLLFFLSTIEIALTIYNNIDNPQFQYLKWGKTKILKIGFIIFAIQKYESIIKAIKSFFLEIGTKGLGLSISSSDYFNDPSIIFDKGKKLSLIILESVEGFSPSTYIFILLALLAFVGFFVISIQIILCWIEFYFLTGISIVFLPFGALDMTGEYYKNVFKTIMSCSIKLCVFNIWILICDKIIKKALSNPPNGIVDLDYALVVCGTAFILVAIMLILPSMTSGLLTGSPQMNAGAAMSAAIGAGAALATNAYHTARMGGKAGTELGSSINKGTEQGGQKGAIYGAKLGGPAGAIVGSWVGAGVGALGGAIKGGFKGAYAAGRYGINQGLLRKPEYGANTKEKKEDSKSNLANTVNLKNAESKNPQTMNTGSAREEDTNATDVLRELQSEQGSKNTANTGTQPIVNGEQGVPSWMQ